MIVVGVYSTPTGMQAVRYLKRHKISYFFNCDGGIISYGEKALKKRLKAYFISGAAGYLSTGVSGDEYLKYYGAEAENIHRYPFTSVSEGDLPERPYTKGEKEEIRRKLGICEERMILAVGNFIPRKGFDILIRAAGLIGLECGIYLAGGEELPEYRKLREGLGVEAIHYIPFMRKEELRRYYFAADLFVLPTREDIWGLVINEAMAAGLPVITTKRCVAGVEMLDEEYLVPAEDEEALAGKIRELLGDEDRLRRAGEENLARSREYTIENMAKRHVEIFERFQGKK